MEKEGTGGIGGMCQTSVLLLVSEEGRAALRHGARLCGLRVGGRRGRDTCSGTQLLLLASVFWWTQEIRVTEDKTQRLLAFFYTLLRSAQGQS